MHLSLLYGACSNLEGLKFKFSLGNHLRDTSQDEAEDHMKHIN